MFKNVKRICLDKITNDAVITFERKLKSISPKTTEALMIDINSFSPLAFSMNICNSIKEFKREKKIPVYTFGENTVMGSALLILASGDKVYSDKFTMFGLNNFSVGKYSFNKFTKNRNIDIRLIASGKHKVRLNPFDEIKKEDEEWVLNILRKQKQMMVENLKEIRGDRFDEKKYLALDDLFIADKAMEVGLIDGFECLDSIAMKEFKGKKTKKVKNKISLGDMIKMIHSWPKIDFEFNLQAEIAEYMLENNLKNNLL